MVHERPLALCLEVGNGSNLTEQGRCRRRSAMTAMRSIAEMLRTTYALTENGHERYFGTSLDFTKKRTDAGLESSSTPMLI